MADQSIVLGYDPGGKRSGGVALLFVEGGAARAALMQTVDCVDDALAWFFGRLGNRVPDAIGIDGLMFWETGASGWRGPDEWLRKQFPVVANSIVAPHSLYGAMVIQGVTLARRLREKRPGIKINETHPKVLFHALTAGRFRYSERPESWLPNWLKLPNMTRPRNEHEWDALISAGATWQGISGRWTHDLALMGRSPVHPIGSVTYFWPPTQVASGSTIAKGS